MPDTPNARHISGLRVRRPSAAGTVVYDLITCAECPSLADASSCLPSFSWRSRLRAAEPVVDWDKAKTETLLHYQSIVRMNTSNPPGNETSVVNYLREVLDREGISYQVFAQEPSRANLVARLKGSGRKKPVLIMGHTDTVGVQPEMWPVDPFGAVRKDGYIWGRGTTDNKDCVAAGLMLMLQLKRLRVPLDRDVIYVGGSR